MIDFINLYLVPALTIGSIYALGAVGISMIFGILRFAHFAHGDLMTVGAYGTLTAAAIIPVHPLLLLPFGIALAIGCALLVDNVFYRPLRKLPTIYTVISSFGVALIFRSLLQLFGDQRTKSLFPVSACLWCCLIRSALQFYMRKQLSPQPSSLSFYIIF